MHVSELEPMKGSVSWTNKPVSYFLHVIDRTKLYRYFERAKPSASRDDDHAGGAAIRGRSKSINVESTSHSSRQHLMNGKTNGIIKSLETSSNDSNSNPKENNEDTDVSDEPGVNGIVVGPTTRRAWSDWCSSKGKSSKENSEDDTAVVNPGRNQRPGNGRGRPRGKKKVLRKKLSRNKVKKVSESNRTEFFCNVKTDVIFYFLLKIG